MTDYVIAPNYNRPIVDDSGLMTQEFRTWVQTINNRSLIIGSGSPESVIESPVGAEYMDELGTAGTIKYIKQKADILGDKSKGWVLV